MRSWGRSRGGSGLVGEEKKKRKREIEELDESPRAPLLAGPRHLRGMISFDYSPFFCFFFLPSLV
jgi:hypothetical protein